MIGNNYAVMQMYICFQMQLIVLSINVQKWISISRYHWLKRNHLRLSAANIFTFYLPISAFWSKRTILISF